MYTDILSWDGLVNTQTILPAISGELNKAAQLCNAKGTGWYLPATEELVQLYYYSNIASTSHSYYGNVSYGSNCVGKGYHSTHIGTLSNFDYLGYRSSTEYEKNISWYQNFSCGSQNAYYKNTNYAVRCVRRF